MGTQSYISSKSSSLILRDALEKSAALPFIAPLLTRLGASALGRSTAGQAAKGLWRGFWNGGSALKNLPADASKALTRGTQVGRYAKGLGTAGFWTQIGGEMIPEDVSNPLLKGIKTFGNTASWLNPWGAVFNATGLGTGWTQKEVANQAMASMAANMANMPWYQRLGWAVAPEAGFRSAGEQIAKGMQSAGVKNYTAQDWESAFQNASQNFQS